MGSHGARNTESLLDKPFHFRDPRTGKATECTLVDYGTSRMRGDWFEVVYEDGKESQISDKEMNEILDNIILS
jgi:hypothetical protein